MKRKIKIVADRFRSPQFVYSMRTSRPVRLFETDSFTLQNFWIPNGLVFEIPHQFYVDGEVVTLYSLNGAGEKMYQKMQYDRFMLMACNGGEYNV